MGMEVLLIVLLVNSYSILFVPLFEDLTSQHFAVIILTFSLHVFLVQLDLGLHECVYKWLVSEEWSLGLGDVTSLDPTLGRTLDRLHATVLEKRRVMVQAEREGVTGAELQVGC